jgi:hypothetical protein
VKPELVEVERATPILRVSDIKAGGDVGFRIESYDGSTPVGKLVVKIDGQWVEVRLSGAGVKKLTTK